LLQAVTKKAGVMGWPVNHSLSPRLHGFWLKHYGIEGSYEAFPVKPEDLASALKGLPAQGLRGVNLTVPHKVAACKMVDSLDVAARRIGAVNLVTVEDNGKLTGRNTDAFGFVQNLLSAGFQPSAGTAFVIGAGGACRAVLAGLIDMGFTEIRITNRTLSHAKDLAREFSSPSCQITPVDWAHAPHLLEGVSLLVNTTSLGMKGQPALDFPLETLPFSATVTDIVYAPLETGLLRQAMFRGHRTIDGLGMLLHQARPAFATFYGRDPEVTDELRRYVMAERT
jgi:shikimate dehydrogenase